MAKYKLLLPKMGESVAEATVIRWTKNPGDYVESDDTVMEIATDKVDSEVPSPVSGKLLERFYKDNDVVQVGAVIAIIETADAEEIVTQKVTGNDALIEATHATSPVSEVHIAAPVIEVQQTAPVAEVPAQVPQAPQPEVKQVEEFKQPVFAEQRGELTQPVPYTERLEGVDEPKTEDGLKNGLRFYSPLVKNIAAQEGISNAELDKIPGTGAEGRLTKDDLFNYIQNRYTITSPTVNEPVEETPTATNTNEPEPVIETPVSEAVFEARIPEPVFEARKPEPVIEAPKAEPIIQPIAESSNKSSASMSGNDEIIEMDRMRRLIADHMVMSKHTSPHVTSFVEADVTNLVLWREKIKNSFEKREGEKITFTPIFIEAVVRAIKDMPMINIQVNGTQIIKKKDINISMATALPSGNLIVPVIKRADELSLIGLTKSVNDLANRARTGKLKPDDVQGGTFTITNVGSFGNVMGTPIINQPQVAILAVGAIKKKPAVIETLQGDMIGIRHMMFLSLSYDHRVVDGALGGSFVRRVADYLENWDPGREI
ncbi:dihydrolipoamide acetyltransferase family protein [Mucilaginibacter sp.]|uniref:dihydrolipoamide acetyltransferase family protein n=1 Tax=Mucilaginibacter sp. TaxID=1882438 RepID=UPI0028459ACB|nr:dihydrolipoamide acetyltransferase family protein [Mucilaginibacter sp.]MDR3694888.1 dihydrolipoamide acetyltransferase family protein [Mucilaginibacter sp.]